MSPDWIILILLIFLPIAAAVSGRRRKSRPPSNRFLFYLKDILVSFTLLAIFFVLKPSIYYPLDFPAIDKGININEEIISGILIPLFLIPFLLSFTRWNSNYPKDITTAKELFGFPVSYLPNTTIEYLLFVFYIAAGVLFEELICRQFMFHSLHSTFNLNGDFLVVASSLLFAMGHIYQGWKGILSNFILGLIFGKLFLLKESLAYPLVLHLFLNLTIVVLAFWRLKDLNKIRKKSEDAGLPDQP